MMKGQEATERMAVNSWIDLLSGESSVSVSAAPRTQNPLLWCALATKADSRPSLLPRSHHPASPRTPNVARAQARHGTS